MQNAALKIAIIKSGRKQYELSKQLGWNNAKISQIIWGGISPSVDDRRAIAGVLGVPQKSIFPGNGQN